MYKYMFYNPADGEVEEFLAKLMVFGRDSVDNVSIENDINNSLKIKLFGVQVFTSLNVPIGEVHFANETDGFLLASEKWTCI